MLSLIERLPVELVGTNVLSYLFLKNIVTFERACGSKTSHQLFLNLISYCPPVVLPTKEHNNREALDWFVNRQCKLSSLTIMLPGDNPCLHVKNLQVEYFDLQLNSSVTIENLQPLLENKISHLMKSIDINEDPKKDVVEHLSGCTGNVRKLCITYSDNCMDWLTAETLVRWKPKEIELLRLEMWTPLISLIVQTCTELTNPNPNQAGF